MATFEVRIRQTIERVVVINESTKADVLKAIEDYGVSEVFSDLPEIESKGLIETKVIKMEKVK